jgi:hypothetical protein
MATILELFRREFALVKRRYRLQQIIRRATPTELGFYCRSRAEGRGADCLCRARSLGGCAGESLRAGGGSYCGFPLFGELPRLRMDRAAGRTGAAGAAAGIPGLSAQLEGTNGQLRTMVRLLNDVDVASSRAFHIGAVTTEVPGGSVTTEPSF